MQMGFVEKAGKVDICDTIHIKYLNKELVMRIENENLRQFLKTPGFNCGGIIPITDSELRAFHAKKGTSLIIGYGTEHEFRVPAVLLIEPLELESTNSTEDPSEDDRKYFGINNPLVYQQSGFGGEEIIGPYENSDEDFED